MIKKILLIMLLLPLLAEAQTFERAKKDFVEELNAILKDATTIHWAFSDKMTVEKPFEISQDSMLSVTVRYTTDSTFYDVCMRAPMKQVDVVMQDIYIIVFFKGEDVGHYKSPDNSTEQEFVYNDNMFFVGDSLDSSDNPALLRLQAKLQALLPFYRKPK
ncbi:hypothetical protein [Flavobacterium sp.]|uniref:hypothetical protein n=1 Tax=Flavobacterium sp. TaxID=239 RepID=UPI0026235B33|nr:hypothetical protein [Flavobacterium sp.]